MTDVATRTSDRSTAGASTGRPVTGEAVTGGVADGGVADGAAPTSEELVARTVLPELLSRAPGRERFLVRGPAPIMIEIMFDSLIHPDVYRSVGPPGGGGSWSASENAGRSVTAAPRRTGRQGHWLPAAAPPNHVQRAHGASL